MASVDKKESKVKYVISLSEIEAWTLYKNLERLGTEKLLGKELENLYIVLNEQFKEFKQDFGKVPVATATTTTVCTCGGGNDGKGCHVHQDYPRHP